MLVPSLLQHCGDTHKSLVGVGTNEGGGKPTPPPLNKVSSSSPSAAWTGITPAGKPTNSEIQQPAHVLSLEDRQHVDIFGHVLWGPLFLTTFYYSSFHQWFTHLSGWEIKQWLPAKLLINSRCSCWVCPLPSGHIDRSACEAKGQDVSLSPVDKTLLSHPNVVKLTQRLHLIMFVPSFTLFTFVNIHKLIHFCFVYFFCVVQP